MKIKQNIQIALIATAILWFIFLLDRILSIDLRFYGIRPRSIEGLWGILFSPFLHDNISHLLANSGAVIILLWVSFSFHRRLTLIALVIIIFMGVVLALPKLFNVDDPQVFAMSLSLLVDSFKLIIAGVSIGLAIALGLGLKDSIARASEKI